MRRKTALAALILVFLLIRCVSHNSLSKRAQGVPPESDGGNLRAVDPGKIPGSSRWLDKFGKLKEAESMMAVPQPQWIFATPREELIALLLEINAELEDAKQSASPDSEGILLQMLVSSYLFNLGHSGYEENIRKNRDLVAALDGNEYRHDWFLADHLVQALQQTNGMRLFLSLLERIPEERLSPWFWKNFFYCAHLCGMHSHALMARQKIEALFGGLNELEKYLAETEKSAFRLPPADETIEAKQIWAYGHSAGTGGEVFLYSRLLGIGLRLDPGWEMETIAYEQQRTFIAFTPQGEQGMNDEVFYTIAVFVYQPTAGETLAGYIEKAFGGGKELQPAALGISDPAATAYVVHDKTMYGDEGGSFFYLAGIEREEPSQPGLRLEKNMLAEPGLEYSSNEQTTYFVCDPVYTRLPDRLFYVFLLDTCQSIHDKSRAVFLDVINTRAILE